MYRKKFGLIVVVVLLAVTAVPVWAAPPQGVHIEVDETIAPPESDPLAPFVATGSAVDAGVVCGTGTVDDLTNTVSGPPGGAFVTIRADKRFTCDDSSGTFDVRLNVRLDLTTYETTARWRVTGGTGAYAHLHADGSLVGTPIVKGASVHDVYDGQMH